MARTPDTGATGTFALHALDVGPGDVCVLERGTRTTWTVHEALRKVLDPRSPTPNRPRGGLRSVAIVADRLRQSYADAAPVPFWLDQPGAPEASAPLDAPTGADLAIVGGFTGLWAAIQAKEERPDRDVVLLERDTVAYGASGRNGGFCDASLTHGLPNGIDRFPDEIETIERLAAESFRGIEETIARFGIDCDWNPEGEVLVARETARGRVDASRGSSSDGGSDTFGVPRSRAGACRARLAHLSRRHVETEQMRHGRSLRARMGPATCS